MIRFSLLPSERTGTKELLSRGLIMAVGVGVGFFEMLIVSSWFLVPLGVPPGEEDITLQKVAPEQCLYYMSSAGVVTPDAASNNATEKLLLDPEIKEFTEQLFPKIKASIQKAAGQAGAPPDQVAVIEAIPRVTEAILTEPLAVYVGELKMRGNDPPDIKAAIVANAKRRRKELDEVLENLQPMLGQVAQPVKIDGHDFAQIDFTNMGAPEGFPIIEYGFTNDYFILGIGKDEVANAMKRMQTPAPAWLTKASQLLKVPRTSTFAYADMKKGIALAREAMGPSEDVNKMLVMSGMSKATSYINVTGLDNRGG